MASLLFSIICLYAGAVKPALFGVSPTMTSFVMQQYGLPEIGNNLYNGEQDNMTDTLYVSGTIGSEETWVTNTVVYLTGDITITSGVRLTVAPGVDVYMKGNRIDVYGTLIAIGDKENPIEFVGERLGGRIAFFEGSDASVLDNVRIEGLGYSFIGGNGGGALQIYASSMLISSTTVVDSPTIGVKVGSGASPVFENCKFENNEYGFYVEGINGSFPGYPVIRNSVFYNSKYGIYIKEGNPDLGTIENYGNNEIYNNIYNVANLSTNVVYAIGNYWGYEDADSVDAYIYDDEEGVYYGAVLFEPFVRNSSLPDLVPEELVISPNRVQTGGAAAVSFVVTNRGGGTAPATRTNVRLSASPTEVTVQDPLLATLATPSLAPGESVTHEMQVTIPGNLAPGTYYVWVIVDVESSAGQNDESNDRIFVSLGVEGEDGGNTTAFRWPVPDSDIPDIQVTQDYAEYDGVNHPDYPTLENKYHGGIDFYTNGKTVVAAAAGKVFDKKDNIDGWGNAVILYHESLGFYTLYAHLEDPVPLEKDSTVNMGEYIGRMGNTGTGTGVHLHFSVMEAGGWPLGYLVDVPDGNSLRDPRIYIYPFEETPVEPVVFRVDTDENVNVHSGPGAAGGNTQRYAVLTQVRPGQQVVAYARSGEWYKIHLPNAYGSVSGWIWGGAGSEGFLVEEPSTGQIEVKDTASVGLNVRKEPGVLTDATKVLTRNGLDAIKLWPGQRFAVLDRQVVGGTPWYKINLPIAAMDSEGWVSGDFVEPVDLMPDLTIRSIYYPQATALIPASVEFDVMNVGNVRTSAGKLQVALLVLTDDLKASQGEIIDLGTFDPLEPGEIRKVSFEYVFNSNSYAEYLELNLIVDPAMDLKTYNNVNRINFKPEPNEDVYYNCIGEITTIFSLGLVNGREDVEIMKDLVFYFWDNKNNFYDMLTGKDINNLEDYLERMESVTMGTLINVLGLSGERLAAEMLSYIKDVSVLLEAVKNEGAFAGCGEVAPSLFDTVWNFFKDITSSLWELIKGAGDWIGNKFLYAFHLNSPADIWVQSSDGKVAFVSQYEALLEIEHSFGYTLNEHKSIVIIGNDVYNLRVQGVGEGTAGLQVYKPDVANNLIALTYGDIPTVAGSEAALTVARENEDYTLSLDQDGDGTVDETMQPETVEVVTSIGGHVPITIPSVFLLHPNYPNPFRTATTFRFDLPAPAEVSLVVYDLLGREVVTVASGMLPAGKHVYRWEAGELPGGVYLYRLHAGGYTATGKMVLVK
ncbi:peptidoglycan DD-metalloendopeptidase family protein [Rhodocaloribacter litoris]|uniref:peptidoglycan DD-metalloendopeptidase family protein n=1 Tax=Rhodocaloribacter litoris TaxID=2558931 RepID=UPI001421C5AD|nr:peptidoglycan DD-metalloendopeptidase family protein [Rhodocaloribacter litoris]QXD15897.1 peptidoglycan DD-metalloendopeptidase family protein [Rhodocaloribacter litoris]